MAKVKETAASKWIVLFSSLILMTLSLGFNFTSTSMLLPVWQEAFQFSEAQYGLLAGAIALGGMIIVFIAGSIYDKFNLKTVLYTFVLLNGLVIMLRFTVNSFSSAYLLLFLSGITSNFIYAGLIKSLSAWFDKKWLLRANGILTSGGSIGFFLGFNLTAPLTTALGGWERIFLLQGGIIFVFGIICFLIIPSRDEAHGAMNVELQVETEGYTFIRRIKELLSSKQVILVLISEFFVSGCILSLSAIGPKAFGGYWSPEHLGTLGLVLSMVNVGSLIGYYTLPVLADKIGYRKFCLPFILFSCICFACSLLSNNPTIAIILNIFGGLGDGLGLMAGRILLLEHPSVAGIKAGTASGMLLTFNKGGSVVFPLIFTTLAAAQGIPVAWIIMITLGVCGIIPLLFTQDTGFKAVAKRQAKQDSNNPAKA